MLSGVRPEDTGSAAGALTTSFQLGQTLGIALMGIVFFFALGAPQAVTPQAARYLFAYQATLPVLAVLAALLVVLVLLLPRPAPQVRSNVFLERAPNRLHGLVHSFYLVTGGHVHDELMRHILRHHLADIHHSPLAAEELRPRTGEEVARAS